MPNLLWKGSWGLLWLLAQGLCLADTIHHELTLRLHPPLGVIEVSDRMHLPESLRQSPVFELLAGLQPRVEQGELQALPAGAGERFRHYRYRGPLDDGVLRLHYRGRPDDPQARGDHGMPLALVNREGVYLDGAAGWYPAFPGHLQTYRLRVELPPGWRGVSTGRRERQADATVWRTDQPQEDIYLMAGPFKDYACHSPAAALEVLLLQDEPALAQRYLAAAAPYLALYSELFGPYPYQRFSVVENRWQTGYGMPSFTLLGSRVLRLPFILHSSLPHEILHNWWGNGVFLSEAGGNWSEGLTAYLADHLLKELVGQGADYRRKALERYANFAAQGRDFPLAEFRARHDDSSQAVGYGKSLMLFHMLRHELGDRAFVAALRRFYRQYRFQPAGFAQLLDAFAGQGLKDVAGFRRDWLQRAGAPALALERVKFDNGRLALHLRQTQPGPAYRLRVPLAVTLPGEAEARWFELKMDGKTAAAAWSLPARPLRVDVDPAFDLFRLLLPGERPASLSRLFGSRRQLLVLPSAAPAEERRAWRRLAEYWQGRYQNVQLIDDRATDEIGDGDAVWLLGWDNRLARTWAGRFTDPRQRLLPGRAELAGERVDPQRQAVVLLDPDNRRPPLGFIGARGAPAIASLARKLTHYGSFGRLLFDLPAVENRLREGLALAHSPLSRLLAEGAVPLRLPAAPLLTGQLAEPEAWRRATCR